MSKYTIIDKYPKGNNHNKSSIISYQVDGCGSDIFKAKMIYVDNKVTGVSYAFFSEEDYQHINTSEDRMEFCNEIKEFQKGGSYRKTHPIKKSEAFLLKEKRNELDAEIRNIDKEIREAEEKERKQKFSTYKLDIDYESLNIYIEGIKSALNNSDRYYIEPVLHIWDGYKLMIKDKELNKPVYVGVIDNDGVRFREIEDYEIPMNNEM